MLCPVLWLYVSHVMMLCTVSTAICLACDNVSSLWLRVSRVIMLCPVLWLYVSHVIMLCTVSTVILTCDNVSSSTATCLACDNVVYSSMVTCLTCDNVVYS